MTAVASEPPTPRQWLTIDGTNWAYYEHTLEQIGDGHLRVTYDRGRMEIMSPSGWHERVKKAFSLLIEAYAIELNIPFLALGSVTCRREDQDRGLEPDECYYFRLLPQISQERDLDLSIDPPPHLAVEIDVSRSSIPRQPIYASLGVPEIWRLDGTRLVVLLRQPDGTYSPSDASLAFPQLPMTEFNRFLQLELTSQYEAVRAFREWVIAGFR